ncbi:glucan endo-1,3-beta-glucosidase [Mangifera indica]|uniref:glucan endo-1,3-beta-glucosidase n=1 Tax=Mangifera indica TaxID=29780 RepID=UPI001CF99594|nr:glucan endo-1,3-beta-glucosidase [Mangifera indica]
MSKTSSTALLLLTSFIVQLAATTSAIGVNYGTLGNNLPPPAEVANFLATKTYIDRIKIFDTNPEILRAFANTNISVTVTAGNGDIPSLTKLDFARQWVAANIAPYYPQTKIIHVAVGNEILQSAVKEWIYNLLLAMKTLNQALVDAGFKDIKVSTPHTLGFLQTSEPPSEGRFRVGYDKQIIAPMLQFLRETKSAFMINPYPYFSYSSRMENYAVFKANQGIYDKNTRITYFNMFDAQMDAVYSAMKRLGYGDVPIVVAETGWPSAGDQDQPACTLENARSFNWHLVRHVKARRGTPLMPNRRFEAYIFGLFNENLKPGPTAERNFGLFYPDFTPVYDAGIMKVAPTPPGKKFCVAKAEADDEALQANIDYVCSKGIDCKPIQAGGACFDPNTVRSHAAFVMNSYYSFHGRQDFNCDFGSTGVITTQNPSYGNCFY